MFSKSILFSNTTLNKHTGAKTIFCQEIIQNLMIEKCEFCEKQDFENVNFVKNETLKMRILSKKNEILKCEILDKLRIFAQ